MINIPLSCCKEYSYDEVCQAARIAETIVGMINRPSHGWKKGMRNNMAVDLCSALYVLGYRTEGAQQVFMCEKTTPNTMSSAQYSDFCNRCNILFDGNYLTTWYFCKEIFDKMIAPDHWLAISRADNLIPPKIERLFEIDENN